MSGDVQRQSALLRSVLFRLQSATVQDLHAVVQHAAGALLDCKAIIGSEKQSPKDGPDAVVLHKLKTLIGTFLNDKTVEKRWAAAVLVKVVVDAGGIPILQSCNAWIQGLLSLLKKNDPITSKRLAMLSLTRIFLLTHGHQTLVRELTTPALPQFITQALSNALPKSSSEPQYDLVLVSFECFLRLLPHHPTVFRPFASQILTALKPLLAPTPSSHSAAAASPIPENVSRVAQKLFPLLPQTTPKNGSSEEWNRGLNDTLVEAQQTTDHIFRCVIEDWKSAAGYVAPVRKGALTAGESQQDSSSPLKLPAWTGIHAGCERVVGLLNVIKSYMMSRTSSSVEIPLGFVHDLLVRILSVTVPSTSNPASNLRNSDEISREERDALWSHLPGIHSEALTLIYVLCQRFGLLLLPICLSLVDQIDWMFGREHFNASIREHTYITMSHLVTLFGASFNKQQAKPLHRMIRTACEDVVPTKKSIRQHISASQSSKGATAGNSILDTAQTQKSEGDSPAPAPPSALRDAASALMVAYLSKIPSQHMPLSTRALVDRTALLSRDERALLASALNPPAGGDRPRASVLPLLARTHPDSLAVEALVRPRMPVIPVNLEGALTNGSTEPANGQDDRDEEDSDDEGNDGEEKLADPFLAQTLVSRTAAASSRARPEFLDDPTSSPRPPPAKRARTSPPATEPVAAMSRPQADHRSAQNTGKGKARAFQAQDVEMSDAAEAINSATETEVQAGSHQDLTGPRSAAQDTGGMPAGEDSDEEFVIPALTLESSGDEGDA